MAYPFKLVDTHLLACLTLMFMAGIVTASLWDIPVTVFLMVSLTGLMALFFCILYRLSRSGQLVALALMLAVGQLFGTISSREPAEPHHIYQLIDHQQDIVAIGRLGGMVTFDGTTSRTTIELQSVRLGPDRPYLAATGQLLLRLSGPWPALHQPGQLLAIRAIVQRPVAYGVPGVFDYPAYLARQGIWITGFCRSPAQIQAIAGPMSFAERLRFSPERLRNTIATFLDQHLTPDIGALYRALLLGDRSHLQPATTEHFKSTGTLHILAISGIHLSILATMLFTVLYWLLRRSTWLILHTNVRKLAGLLCLPPLVGYTLLAGTNTPVVRACLMSTLVILAFCSNRPRTLSALVALAALLVLTVSPQALFTVSFQLSFTAFIGICLVLPAATALLHRKATSPSSSVRAFASRLLHWALAAILVSLAATLATAPIVIYHFHRFPLVGPLANLIMEPLICLWALPWGFAALPFVTTVPDLATCFLTAGSLGLRLALWFAGLFQNISWTTLWLPRPGWVILVFFYCTLLHGLRRLGPGHGLLAKISSTLLVAVALFLLLLPGNPSEAEDKSPVTVSFLDVGQGSATVIGFADNSHMLVDGGSSTLREQDVGQQIIAPFLWHSGITRLETIVLTHPDGDHTNGIPFLLEHFSVKTLYLSTLGGNARYQELIALARKKRVKVIVANQGEKIQRGDPSVTCLANTANWTSGTAQNEGLILLVQQERHRLLLPGDIGSGSERQLLTRGLLPRIDFLLAGHHGSKTSNSSEFLQHLRPRAIFVSAGRSANRLFPADRLRHYCQTRQLPLLVTAERGSIRLVQRSGKVDLQVVRDLRKNPLRRHLTTWLTTERFEMGKDKDLTPR